jgi:uncharacterized membrane protein YidH (DUF202 family)
MVHDAPQRDARFESLEDLGEIIAAGKTSGLRLEHLLAERGVPKHELLRHLADAHGCPFVEYDESLTSSQELVRRLNAEALRRDLWFPLSVGDDSAQVIAWDPGDPAIADDVRQTLGVAQLQFLVALPSDIIRIIENNLDLNPGFPRTAGRTPLAKVRTFLAERRSLYACIRTSLARGRTGLAILRTGFSFIAIAIVLHRIFGVGLLTVLEIILAAAGTVIAVEGLRWYLPTRRSARALLACDGTTATHGTTVLQARWSGGGPVFTRSDAVNGSDALRAEWSNLSPVMRRRFLASDRTDLAEERTSLACLRTRMARARTGLAFTRTGIAFAGLGIALFRIRAFQTGLWPLFDAVLVLTGAAMILEGFVWYFLDRRAGAEGRESVRCANETPGIWQAFFPPRHEPPSVTQSVPGLPPVSMTHAPGIWGTTGLALERTMLADRRNVMARLRTIMARSRTGLAFVRTGMSICAVGMALLAYFGISSVTWAALEVFFLIVGMLLIADGLYWHLPAEKLRKQFPYCFCDVEIVDADYGRPARSWGKAVFSHDDV